MKSLLVSSAEVKLGMMMVQRFQRGASIVLTEGGKYSADIVIINKKNEIVEYEVKVSLADFKQDFFKNKHVIYNQSLNEHSKTKINSVPHYFSFLVPETIVSEVFSKLVAYPNYGIVSFKNIPFEANVNWIANANFFKTIKIAKSIRNAPIISEEISSFTKRMSSELIREKIKNIKG